MRWLAAFAMSVSLLSAQADREPVRSVTGVRHWSLADATRVAVQVSGDFAFRTGHLHNPERVYFDILNARPRVNSRTSYTEALEDPLVSRIRVAANQTDVTRVVLDLAEGTGVSASRLVNPDRLMIELRRGAAPPAPEAPAETAGPPKTIARPTPPQLSVGPPIAVPPIEIPPAFRAAAASPNQTAAEPPKPQPPKREPDADAKLAKTVAAEPPPKPQLAKREPIPDAGLSKTVAALPPATPSEVAKAAKRTSTGGSSLVRALGLKLSRVVIDPGHGGHDQGTAGQHGLLEKDLVLDVAQRLGAMIEKGMDAEVIYTRSDDTFLPLQARTALANDNKADLFLSIHANSSPVAPVTGIETFYLGMTGTKYATDVAARENASFEKSVFDLPELVQQIAKNDKAQESKEFAERIQAALYAFSVHNVPGSKNRGIKSAPFVVLIGAHMPSVLAEIGFLTNVKEEILLKKPDYRQRLAEALYHGVSRYAESLSHFQTTPAPAGTVATKTAARPLPATQ
jgi:N-acetylmuramoyl-L-alanine amidase